MRDWIIAIVAAWPPPLAVAILAMFPVTELRASVPIAITVWHLTPWEAFFWSGTGSLVPIAITFLLFTPALDMLSRRVPRIHEILDRHLRALAAKHRDAYDRYGALFLGIFVAIPLPGPGVWSASILAVIFGIKPAYAIPSIIIGMLVGDALVVLITQGTLGALSFLL